MSAGRAGLAVEAAPDVRMHALAGIQSILSHGRASPRRWGRGRAQRRGWRARIRRNRFGKHPLAACLAASSQTRCCAVVRGCWGYPAIRPPRRPPRPPSRAHQPALTASIRSMDRSSRARQRRPLRATSQRAPPTACAQRCRSHQPTHPPMTSLDQAPARSPSRMVVSVGWCCATQRPIVPKQCTATCTSVACSRRTRAAGAGGTSPCTARGRAR